jgi:two-component system, OmpR family, sensor kinase
LNKGMRPKSIFLPRSLRWRLQMWLAFLLVCVLAGFAFSVYQLQRVSRFDQIDGELETRISALTRSVRELYGDPGRGQMGPLPGSPSGGPPERRPPADKDFGGPPGRRPPPDKGFGGPRGRHPFSDDKNSGGPPGHPPPPDHSGFGGPPREGRQGDDGPGPEDRAFDGRGRGGPRDRPGPVESNLRAAPQAEKPALQLSAENAALFGNGSGDYYYIVWYRDASVLKRSDSAPADLGRPAGSERDTLVHLRTRNQFREALDCSGMGDCMLVGRSIDADLRAMRNFAWTLLGAGAAVLALALALGFWFTTRAIRPIERISAAARRISQGNLSERVEGADSGDELGSLAAVLNSTFGRLESAFARQRQFTADAAHELRTPLAVIISETQTTLARERTSAEYRETVEACLDTAQQMRRLTESLLELARFEAETNEEHPHTSIDLAETACLCVERIRPLAEQHRIQIQSDFMPAPAFTNADRIAQVITNLLTNAIHYNKADGKVSVATRSEPEVAVITISDTGVGIAETDIPHIFDRFYRVDKARSRAEGHTGLGLAICKTIIDAEGGTIEVASVVNSGTTFSVRLPVRP